MEQVGVSADRVLEPLLHERAWDGNTITEAGVYRGITLEQYHGKTDLLDGPSVSKSALKWMMPSRGGSPKAFWGRWAHNPDHIKQDRSDALDFGKAVHCLLLGDEDFSRNFVISPFDSFRTKEAREWRDGVRESGMTIVTDEQIDRIKRMRDDAAANPIVRSGILDGRVERSMFARDERTGIWLRSRPDNVAADGIYADLKTASSLSEDFLERQAHDMGYFLQAAMTRMICRELGIPFSTFVLVYVLNDDVPDTAHVELSEFDIDRAEREIRWALDRIRVGLDTGEWPGMRPFADGTRPMQIKPWAKDRTDAMLQESDQ